MPKCVRAGVSIVIGAVHNTGILAGRDSWNYRPAPPEIVARVNAIRAVCDSHGVPLIAAALQFPLAHPAVSAVLPGPRDVQEMEENSELLRYPIPPALVDGCAQCQAASPGCPDAKLIDWGNFDETERRNHP
jgi:D-threo-aldose 1-dehydrogenase